MTRWAGLIIVLLLAALVGWRAALPPAPLPASAPADSFSAGRAMADIRIIAARPHPTGSAANDAVRGHLVRRLQVLGFAVRTQTVFLPERAARRLAAWGDPDARFRRATTIIALRPGRDRNGPAIGLMAHYDSVWGSPGAGDDAAGVAAALEIARAIPVAAQRRDLAIIFTDAEELGLVGARGFFGVAAKGSRIRAPGPPDPLARRLGVLINLETRGGGGRAFMFETSQSAGNLVRLYAASVADPATTSLAVKVYELLPNSTDFTPARQAGIAGLNFAFTGRAELYHSPLATPDAIDAGSVQHLGVQALAVTRALLTAEALPPPAADLAFGDLLGLTTLAYPPAWGWLPIAIVAACLLHAARTRRDWRPARVAAAMLDGLVAAAAVAVIAYAGNLLSGADAPANYYDRLAALPRLEVMALLAAVVGLAVTLALAPRQRSRWDGWLGGVALLLLLLVALQIVLPAGGPALAWPLVPAALALALSAQRPHGDLPLAGRGLAAAAAVFGVAIVGGFAHNLLLGIGISAPSAVALFAPLVLALLWPLVPEAPARRPLWIIAGACLALQAGLALWVRWDAPAPGIAAYDPKA